jgi:hypothetical protein
MAKVNRPWRNIVNHVSRSSRTANPGPNRIGSVPIILIYPPQQKKAFLRQLLDLIATQEVPNRPNRIEPRVKKRRPKKYNLMNKPRAELRAALIGA